MKKEDDDIVLMGHFSGLYGVRGWLRVHSYSQSPVEILGFKRWRVRLSRDEGNDDGWQAFELVSGRPQGKGIVAQIALIDGAPIDDRDVASGWVGAQIGIARRDLPKPAEGEVYLADLLGLTVSNCADEALGEVANILETGAHPVLQLKNGEEELLIPFVRDVYVLDINLEQGTMRVDWEADY